MGRFHHSTSVVEEYGTFRIERNGTRNEVLDMPKYSHGIRPAISPDECLFSQSPKANQIRLYDVSTGEAIPRWTYDFEKYTAFKSAFLPTGRSLAVVMGRRSPRWWLFKVVLLDIASGSLLLDSEQFDLIRETALR
jgi:hypothetical protein